MTAGLLELTYDWCALRTLFYYHHHLTFHNSYHDYYALLEHGVSILLCTIFESFSFLFWQHWPLADRGHIRKLNRRIRRATGYNISRLCHVTMHVTGLTCNSRTRPVFVLVTLAWTPVSFSSDFSYTLRFQCPNSSWNRWLPASKKFPCFFVNCTKTVSWHNRNGRVICCHWVEFNSLL